MAKTADDLIDFVNKSPSPYHAAGQAKDMAIAAGFEMIDEADAWSLQPGGAYTLLRGGKTMAAFRVGTKPIAEAGARIIVAHTDSPVLKVKPRPAFKARDAGMLTAEIYGSPLLHTWLDRDLKLCGMVWTADKKGHTHRKQIELDDLSVRVNSLAPHLKTQHKTEGVVLDRQKDLRLTFSKNKDGIVETLHGALREASGLKGEVISYDLCLADKTPGGYAGADKAFISAPRLDNLFSSYTALKGLLADEGPTEATRMVVLYDAEEIGSTTWTGARSSLLDMLLSRINAHFGGKTEDNFRARAKSILISADMAHSEHPSFKEATDPDHVPSLNGGIAVKSSAMANYAIAHDAEAWFTHICQEAGLPVQRFMYRCDHGGGSSVGPITSTAIGMPGVDVGCPLLAMHSIREMAGTEDVDHAITAFRQAFMSDVPLTS